MPLLLVALLLLVLAAPAQAGQRVLGGAPATADQAPWAVFVFTGGNGMCSGTVVSPTEVVTAGHCLFTATGDARPASGFTVAAGWQSTDVTLLADQTVGVASALAHPVYPGRGLFPGDVAILRLATPLTFTPRVGPLPLATERPAVGAAVALFGFGTPAPGQLRGIGLRVVDPSTCGPLAGSQLCAASDAGEPCSGDSGAGLVTATGQLAGLLSGGPAACTAGNADVYTDLTSPLVAPWLEATLAPPVPAARATAYPDAAVVCDGRAAKVEVVDAAGQVRGAGAYRLRPADAGAVLRCRATSSSGVTSESAPVTVPVFRPAVEGRGLSVVALPPAGSVVRVTGRRGAPVARTAFGAALPRLPVGAYTVCLESPPTALQTAGRECVAHRVDGRAATLVLGATRTRDGVRLRLAPEAAGASITVTAGGRSRRVRARRTVTVRVPRGPVRVELPAIAHDGAAYRAGRVTLRPR